MMIKKSSLIILLLSILIFYGNVEVFSMNTGFSTNEITAEERQRFLSNIQLSLTDKEPRNNTISCFDVNSSGLIAIGSTSLEKKYISVYNSIGEFQYGYVFYCNQDFGIEWSDDSLIIYFVRSDVAALFDSRGVNTEIKTIEDTVNNNSYWNTFVFSKERAIEGNKYYLNNNLGLLNFFTSTYSQLVKEDSDGNKTLIYDANLVQLLRVFCLFIVVVVFVTIIIHLLRKHIAQFKTT